VISNSTRKEPNQSSVYTGEVDPAIAMHVLAVCFCYAMSRLRIEGFKLSQDVGLSGPAQQSNT
jgi:hypothetical protein